MNKHNIKYNELFYETGPQKFENIVNDKFENVHQMLFNNALRKYFNKYHSQKYSDVNDFKQFISTYAIIELRNKTYNLPSTVIISKKTFPYRKEKIDLSDYWNKYEFIENNKDIEDLLEDDDLYNDAKLIYIDYVRNRCKFRSKINNKEFWATLDYINKDTEVDDEMTLKNTFGSLLKNI